MTTYCIGFFVDFVKKDAKIFPKYDGFDPLNFSNEHDISDTLDRTNILMKVLSEALKKK